MESLAILVAVIVLTILSLGPIAIALSFVPHAAARIGAYVIAGCSVVGGLWLATAVDSSGARIMGLISVAFGAIAIWNSYRRSQS
jgi:hypothetical protein